MIPRRRYDHVLALCLQSRGFAFALFESFLSPIDWGIRHARTKAKNAQCLAHLDRLLARYSPDVLVLEDVPARGVRRATRIHELHHAVIDLAQERGVAVRLFTREAVLSHIAPFGAVTKQALAETIAQQLPALRCYVPPPRKPWLGQHPNLGIFEAAALAWVYFERERAHGEPATRESADSDPMLPHACSYRFS